MDNINQTHRTPASRVSIDGSKIKFIRESKGLTQLYIATFLGVTPDTVSRWENRRYPTVKWENVERLAEALEVDVSEILDFVEDGAEVDFEEREEGIVSAKTSFPKKRYVAFALLIISVLLGIVIVVSITSKNVVSVTAARYLPIHIPYGQPFPVVVRVDSHGEGPFSFILQEQLPEGFVILRGVPEIASKDPGKNTVKWISSSPQNPFFLAYLVQAAPGSETTGNKSFKGQIKADNAPRFQQDVMGDSELEISNYHWVDSNSDGVIDDEEILMVYSSAELLNRLGVDMEGIKRIWSAGKYKWDSESKEFQVLH